MDAIPTGGPSDWAASGAVGPNGAYRSQTLQYRDVELNFDETVSYSTLKNLALTAFWSSVLVFVLLGLLPAILAGDPDAMSPGLLFSIVVFWVVLLAVRLNEPVSEWKTLLEDKAAASSSAYAAIYGALARRRIPVSAVPARVRSDITPEVVHNRLVITSGRYVAYVTVFAYGTSLYVGWTMWRSRPGAVVIGHFVKDIVGGILNRAGNVQQMLRTERPRAMREAVHSAAREGWRSPFRASRCRSPRPSARNPGPGGHSGPACSSRLRSAGSPAVGAAEPARAAAGSEHRSLERELTAIEASGGVLTVSDGTTVWAWTAVRIDAAADLTETQEYADLPEAERRIKAVAAETAWLTGQWDTAHGERVELRYLTDPAERGLTCALLGRVSAPTPALAMSSALALRGRLAALPRHVHASPVEDTAEVARLLTPSRPSPSRAWPRSASATAPGCPTVPTRACATTWHRSRSPRPPRRGTRCGRRWPSTRIR